jgi:hypothetical protein
MSSFLFNLAQRGAGLAPVLVVQPVATPYFAADLRTAHTTKPEGTPVDETTSEISRISRSGVTASTQEPLVERPEPQHLRQPSPSQSHTDTATTHEQEAWPDELNKPEPSSNPQRVPNPASLPVHSRAEETPPSGPASGSKVEAEPTEPPATIRAMPQIREAPRHPAQPSPSQFQADTSTAHERESSPRELDRPEARSDSISDPKRIPKPSSMPVGMRSKETSPSPMTVGSEVEAEPAEPPATIRVMPQIREVTRQDATVSGQPDASTPEATPSGLSSDSRTRLLTRLIPAEPADRSQILPGASDKVETVPVATPAIAQPPATKQPFRQSSTLSGKLGVTPSVPQPIQVRIGTIEVRANTPPDAPPPEPRLAQGPSGFDGYTMIRSYMSWERH